MPSSIWLPAHVLYTRSLDPCNSLRRPARLQTTHVCPPHCLQASLLHLCLQASPYDSTLFRLTVDADVLNIEGSTDSTEDDGAAGEESDSESDEENDGTHAGDPVQPSVVPITLSQIFTTKTMEAVEKLIARMAPEAASR